MVSKSMSIHQSIAASTKKMTHNEVDFLKNKVKELEASLIQANELLQQGIDDDDDAKSKKEKDLQKIFKGKLVEKKFQMQILKNQS